RHDGVLRLPIRQVTVWGGLCARPSQIRPMRPLFWLCYSVGGSFEGLLLIDGLSVMDACRRAELRGLNPGGECEARELPALEARYIPRRFIGRLLQEDEAADLDRILV